jgi:hypothetical protein
MACVCPERALCVMCWLCSSLDEVGWHPRSALERGWSPSQHGFVRPCFLYDMWIYCTSQNKLFMCSNLKLYILYSCDR